MRVKFPFPMSVRLHTLIACAIASTMLAAEPRTTLKVLSDDELIAFMRGGVVRDAALPRPKERRGNVPPGFWSMPPRDAALALFEANRTDDHRKYFNVTIGKTKERPPDSGTFVFEDRRSMCGYRTEMAYRLEFNPERASLAYGRSADVTRSDGLNETRRGFDFREADAPAEKARHLVQTIWWLRFVELSWKSQNRAGGNGSWSGADGAGFMCLRDALGKIEFSASGSIPHDTLSEGWGFDMPWHEQVGLASLIFPEEFIREAELDWTVTACCGGEVPGTIIPTLADPRAPELENLREIAARWLRRGLENPDVADEPLCAMALEAACHAGWADFSPLAAQVRTRVPLSAAEMRLDDLERKIATWKKEHPNLDDASIRSWTRRKYPHDEEAKMYRARDPDGAYAALDKLRAEKDGIEAKRNASEVARRGLHDTAGRTVRQLPAANDPAALSAWFIRGGDGASWAFQRLVQIAPEKVPDALAGELREGGPQHCNYGALAFLAGVAPDRAREVVATWPLDAKWLEGKTGLALTEGRIPHAQWLQRVLAEKYPDGIFLAVPWQEPLRYGEPELDEALRGMAVTTQFKDESVTPAVEHTVYDRRALDAMTALALRRGAAEWPALCAAWRDVPTARVDLLAPLAVVAQSKPDEFAEAFQKFASEPVRRWERDDVLLAIWAADTRGLLPQLAAVATAGPDDPEVQPSADAAAGVFDPKFPSHLARKIGALWRERDTVTRAKMLLAFGAAEFRARSEFQTKVLLRRFLAEFRPCARALDAAQRDSLREFITRLEHDEWRQQHWMFFHHAPREMLRAARAELDGP